MPNPIVHWELNTKDAKKTQEFLASLFGWHVDANNPMNYGMIDTHTEKGADGGIHDSDEAPKGTMVYIEVDDLQAYRLGGHLNRSVGMAERLQRCVDLPPGPIHRGLLRVLSRRRGIVLPPAHASIAETRDNWR